MRLKEAGLAIALLAAPVVVEASEVEKVKIGRLERGQIVEIRTEDRYYRGEMVNPKTGETLLRASHDGERFTEARRVYLLGATRGEQAGGGGISLMLMNQIKVGMRMELGVDTLDQANRRLSSPVKSIEVLPVNYTVAQTD